MCVRRQLCLLPRFPPKQYLLCWPQRFSWFPCSEQFEFPAGSAARLSGLFILILLREPSGGARFACE